MPALEDAHLVSLSDVTLSVSGWRKIMASSGKANGIENTLRPHDERFVFMVGLILGDFFKKVLSASQTAKTSHEKILIGRDTRPTGKAIQSIISHVFAYRGVTCADIGIQSLPQAMAGVGHYKDIRGLLYITASHNPAGYNGFKIIDAHGAVLGSRPMNLLIRRLVKVAHSPSKAFADEITSLHKAYKAKGLKTRKNTFTASLKTHVQKAYNDQLNDVCWKLPSSKSTARLQHAMKHAIKKAPVPTTIVCDYNGSARLKSIDAAFLKKYGVHLEGMNTQLGVFPHRIVPEGRSMHALRSQLMPYREEVLWGTMVDTDGDRGNLVFYHQKRPLILEAQDTFVLAAASEIMYHRHFLRQTSKKLAIITNEVTSLAVKALATCFKVHVFEAEVGEANLIALGQEKTKEGYQILLLGEGSNGGCIIPPSKVRDPLTMTMSLMKLLFLRDAEKRTMLEVLIAYLHEMGSLPTSKNFKEKFSIHTLPPNQRLSICLRLLNPYKTTSVFAPKALLRLEGKSLLRLKETYISRFKRAFDDVKALWQHRYDFATYQIVLYQGTRSYDVTSFPKPKRSSVKDLKGGLKVTFYNLLGQASGFVWFRESQTEPVLRLAVEVKGPKPYAGELLAWQKQLILQCMSRYE